MPNPSRRDFLGSLAALAGLSQMPVAPGKKCSPYNFRFLQDDPLKVMRVLWPKDRYTREQEEMAYSFWFNVETYAKAANEMGKDFITGRLIPTAFLTRWPCRIVTTSTKDDHLDVLWGEVHRAIRESKIPLTVEQGGPLIVLQRELRKIDYTVPLNDPRVIGGRRPECSISYVKSMVANDASMDAMGGHHATPMVEDGLWHTAWIADEASGINEMYYPVVRGWAKRLFVFGNAWPCNTPFKWAFKGRPGTNDRGGDIKSPFGDYYTRKCISIPVSTSPNVRYARAQLAAGINPTDEILVPGVKRWSKFLEEDQMWSPEEKCVRHDAEWYEGPLTLLFPQEWLDRAEQVADRLASPQGRPMPFTRKARAIGVDPSEGGDKCSMAAVDEYGLIELVSRDRKSMGGVFNTALIPGWIIEFVHKHGLQSSPQMVAIDAGGGVPHADRLRMKGYNIRVIRFGAPVSPVLKRAKRLFPERVEVAEDKYMYLNLRAQMYHELSQLLDPDWNPTGFGIPRKYGNLRSELSPIPKDIDDEGRYFLRSKQRSTDDLNTGKRVPTLTELIGHSPDEADALVLAVYAMQNKLKPTVAGVAT